MPSSYHTPRYLRDDEDFDLDNADFDCEDGEFHIDFAAPGSALRASSARNPRNLPCPTCGEPNKLTPADRAQGYQCDDCADRSERGGW